MKEIIDIHQPDSFDRIIEAIQKAPVIVQFPRVFVLLAAPTQEGAAMLDQAKNRQPNKNYGTAIGDLEKFSRLARPETLPSEFKSAADFSRLTGCFLRVYFESHEFNSTVIRGGTHQGLIIDGIHRELFIELERSFSGMNTSGIWGKESYYAPLCTSCNVSGHPDGSITTMGRAIEFADSRGIDLMVTAPQAIGEMGSYPIFGIYKEGIDIHREGPNLENYKRLIPEHLRIWEEKRAKKIA